MCCLCQVVGEESIYSPVLSFFYILIFPIDKVVLLLLVISWLVICNL